MIKASICTIGDEILIGQTVDTNSSNISRALNGIGVKVGRMVSIADSHDDIMGTLDAELGRNDIVIVTGGLGPTKDDITKKALYDLSGATSYKTDESQLEIIHHILSSRGLDLLEINLAQASVPNTCDVITNRLGTAPVMVFRFPESRYGHKATLYSLPGVPYEAIGAMEDVLGDIRQNYRSGDIYHKNIMTFGLAESALSELIEPWENSLPEHVSLAYLPDPVNGVKLRLTSYLGDRNTQEAEIAGLTASLREILGDYIYSEEEDSLAACVGRLLERAGKTVSCAESCTGGTIASLFTSVPGSSAYFLGSVTSYANSVKTGVLGVPEEILDEHGAVSSETVAAMAEGVRRITGSDYAVSTSGIAGPGGGSAEKPVGTVWVGVASRSGVETFTVRYSSDRKRNIERFSAFTLNKLRIRLLNELSL
ncbi:MAG: CinA family nicotinamide mononucleotide deamidase-related protein [Bacteroidales bacterium]|nr:CinA family nicotinamide mononucleotide deamidase-related protein [Bacteroidales bacterium]